MARPESRWQEIQAGRPSGGGNRVLVRRHDGEVALLKLYRRRGSWLREAIKALASPRLEARRGVRAAERCALEREALGLWRAHGFDVPALLDLPLPEGCDARRALWLEFVEGELLSAHLADPARSLAEKGALVERLGREDGARHRAAVRDGAHLLVQEHASVKHVIVAGERLVHFDLETAFHRRLPIVDALARELSSTLRSLHRFGGADFDALAGRYVAAHPEPALLREAAQRGVHAAGLGSRLRRRSDRGRRAAGSTKTDMLRWLLDAPLAGGPS